MAVNLITPTAYARHRGCDEKAVRKAIAANRISLIDGKVDPAVADIQWEQNTRARIRRQAPAAAPAAPQAPADAQPAAGGPDSPPVAPAAGDSYSDHRSRREKAEAERAELEVKKMAGRLVERDKVEAAVFDLFRSLRDRVMAVPRRCAPTVLGMPEVREIELAMEDELRRALDAFDQAAAGMEARLT
ncbi:elements of external origin [Methylibium sp.]|uniref:elements of external origin n=1 Tax=Methylibium sp. TaxID=2067992 RepID=UPI003D0F22BA